ncbi:hypothetical protein BDV09DRAFT_85227 [Aspergillus tetrazonus]
MIPSFNVLCRSRSLFRYLAADMSLVTYQVTIRSATPSLSYCALRTPSSVTPPKRSRLVIDSSRNPDSCPSIPI